MFPNIKFGHSLFDSHFWAFTSLLNWEITAARSWTLCPFEGTLCDPRGYWVPLEGISSTKIQMEIKPHPNQVSFDS